MARAGVIAALLGACVGLAAATPAGAAIRLEKLGTFDQPVYVASPPGGARELAVVERYGRIRLLRDGRRVRTLLADLRSDVLITNPREQVDQRGLFSMAFAPDHRRSGRFYVQYVARDGRMRVDELRRGSREKRRVLDLGPATTQHHGGQLQMARDGRLYVSTGYNETPAIAQDPFSPGGKILRVDPRAPGAAPEVYALGLRNPWRFSLDRRTGAMLIGDVGEGRREEVNVIARGAPAGRNFGFPAYEGRHRTAATDVPGATPPALSYPHTRGRCSITGGYVVRDRRLPALAGRYVYGDLCDGRLRSARFRGGRLSDARPLGLQVDYLVSFGEDWAGRLHAVSFGGAVYRLRATR